MKKTPIILAAALTVSATAVGASAADSSLIVLGDSITTGYGLDGYIAGDNSSAAGSFANQLALNYTSYNNFAVDGRTTEQLLTALDDEDVSAALSGADTIVISIGGNDFLQPMISAVMSAALSDPDIMNAFSGNADETDYMDLMQKMTETIVAAAQEVDTDKVCQNINDILAAVKSSAPDAQVLILTVYDPFEGVTGMEVLDVVAREKLAELNSGIADAADANGADIIDVFTAFKGNALGLTNISKMDIHPNADGHSLIYSLLTDKVELPAAPTAAEVTIETTEPKGSPDTGVENIAIVGGLVMTATAGLFLSRRRR